MSKKKLFILLAADTSENEEMLSKMGLIAPLRLGPNVPEAKVVERLLEVSNETLASEIHLYIRGSTITLFGDSTSPKDIM